MYAPPEDEIAYGARWDAAVSELWDQGLRLVNGDEPMFVKDGLMVFRLTSHERNPALV